MSPHLKNWRRRLRQEFQEAKRVAILGVGNKLKGDDAAGILCAEGLNRLMRGKIPARLKILLGREAPENQTGRIRKFNPDLVLILDAVLGSHKPGAVFLAEKSQIADETVSTHKVSLALVADYLEKSVGCRVLILGIQPQKIEFGAPASEPVKESAGKLAEYLAALFF